MADANEVIRRLAMQLGQAVLDRTIAQVDAEEARSALVAAGVVEVGEAEERPLEPVKE